MPQNRSTMKKTWNQSSTPHWIILTCHIWLSSLAEDAICGHDNQNYSQYAMAFQNKALLCLDDNVDELKAMCSSLNGGTAHHLV